jgi:hypothetical protein
MRIIRIAITGRAQGNCKAMTQRLCRVTQRLCSDFAATLQRLFSDSVAISSPIFQRLHKPNSKLMESDFAANLRRFRTYSTATLHLLSRDCTTNENLMLSNFAATLQRFRKDCEAIALRFRSDAAKVAQRSRRDSAAIPRSDLCCDFVPIFQRFRSDFAAIFGLLLNDFVQRLRSDSTASF